MRKSFLFLLLFTSAYVIGQTSYFNTGAGSTKLNVQEVGNGKPVVLLAGGPGINAVYLEPVWRNLQLNTFALHWISAVLENQRFHALATKPTNDAELFGQPGVNKYAVADFVSTEKERVCLLRRYKALFI